jgi:uncharacterized OB-fold protein
MEVNMTLLDHDQNAPKAWRGNLPITSRYTYGIAGEKFFRAIKDEGKIFGTYCPKCERTYVPAVLFCERCLSELVEWTDAGNSGIVHTYTLLYENYDGTSRSDPEIVALITIGDGGLVHRLDEISPEDVEIGLMVEAVFKNQSEREGSISDIRYFRPVK